MDKILAIMSHTPIWVWLIFIYLLFIGIKTTKKTVISLYKLFIIPMIFLGINFHMLLSADFLQLIIVFSLSAFMSFYLYRKVNIEPIKDQKSVCIPGSYSNLIIFMLFFAVKYYFGYLHSLEPTLALKYLPFEEVIQFIFTGYFLGRATAFLYQYKYKYNLQAN